MKKSLFKAASAALALLAVGCVQEVSYEDTPVLRSPRQLTDSLEGPSSKTTVSAPDGNDKCKVSWESGDVINYVTDSSQEVSSLEINEAGSSAVISPVVGPNDTFMSAVYGAEIEEWSADTLRLSGFAPSMQTRKSFAEAHVCVAHTDTLQTTDNLVFQTIAGIVKFKINRSDVHHVVFQAAKDGQGNRKVISGDGSVSVKFNAQTGEPVTKYLGTHGTTITIITEGCSSSDEFYICLLPCELPGFEISLFDANNVRLAKASSSNPLTITRNKIVNLGTIPNGKTVEDTAENLSQTGTANCYIVSSTGYYRFKATVKGNSNTPLDGTPEDAYTMWSSYGATVSGFNSNSVVSDVSYQDGFVYFMANGAGNAGIAVRDNSGTILWSWHIWVWPGYELGKNSQEYYNKTGPQGKKYVMLDRNIGADDLIPPETDKSDIKSWGFIYQWGRKDPFIGRAKSFKGESQSGVKSTAATGTLEYTVKHPRIFVYSEETGVMDWHYGSRNNTLWGVDKTENDPCPLGWKVPEEYVWQYAIGSGKTQTWYGLDKIIGYNFTGKLGAASTIFYPCSGYIDGTKNGDGSLKMTYSNSSVKTHWWSAGVSGVYAYVFSTDYANNKVVPHTTTYRQHGLPVRCQLDGNLPEVPVTKVTLSAKTLDLAIAKSATLTATVEPSSATNKTVTWESTDESVATVSPSTGNEVTVTGISGGTCKIKATAGGKTASCDVSVAGSDEINLSKDGTANCYLVSSPGKYCFRVDVKGNDETQPVGDIDEFYVVWQSDGTASYATSSPRPRIIADKYFTADNFSEYYTAPFFHFETPDPLVNGNIVIAARKNGSILWSWHIWVCNGYDPDASAQDYYKQAGTVMDRNLGALSATPGNLTALGLLYQWGRKDPFVTFYGLTTDSPRVTTYPSSWPVEACTSNSGTIDYSVKHPKTYIKQKSTSETTWLYTADNTLWSSTKTIYDPCPPGWRVPDGGTSGLWAKASGQTSTITQAHDAKNKGQLFTNIFAAGDVWYPFAGFIEASNGAPSGQAAYGYYWSVTVKSAGVSNVFFISSGTSNKSYTAGQYRQAGALSVRCVKE